MLEQLIDICRSDFAFESFTEVDNYFKRIINLYKQMNYSEFRSEKFNKFEKDLMEVLKERQVA
jgi:V/A-type H+-transporting ATPase subunit A